MSVSIGRLAALRLACATAIALATAGAGATGIFAQSKPAARAEARRRLHRQDQGGDRRPAHPDRAGRSHAGLRQGAVAAEVPRLHPGRARASMTYYKDIVRYLDALDKASDRVTMFKIGVSDEGRDMFAVAVADEATIKQLDKYRQITAQLTDPRKLTDDAGEAAHRDRQADLLRVRQHPFARDRQPRDADGAGLPARGRGDAVHPDDPQQHHLRLHAGERGGRPREAGRQLRRAAEGAAVAVDGLLGQVRPARQQPRRHRRRPAPHAGDAEDVPRLASAPSGTTCTSR